MYVLQNISILQRVNISLIFLPGWSHVICALFIPEAWFGNVQTMEPIILKGVPPERFNKVRSVFPKNNYAGQDITYCLAALGYWDCQLGKSIWANFFFLSHIWYALKDANLWKPGKWKFLDTSCPAVMSFQEWAMVGHILTSQFYRKLKYIRQSDLFNLTEFLSLYI